MFGRFPLFPSSSLSVWRGVWVSARLFDSPHTVVREELIPLNSGGERVKRLKKTIQQCIARRTEGGKHKGKGVGEAEVGGWVPRECAKGQPLGGTSGRVKSNASGWRL